MYDSSRIEKIFKMEEWHLNVRLMKENALKQDKIECNYYYFIRVSNKIIIPNLSIIFLNKHVLTESMFNSNMWRANGIPIYMIRATYSRNKVNDNRYIGSYKLDIYKIEKEDRRFKLKFKYTLKNSDIYDITNIKLALLDTIECNNEKEFIKNEYIKDWCHMSQLSEFRTNYFRYYELINKEINKIIHRRIIKNILLKLKQNV